MRHHSLLEDAGGIPVQAGCRGGTSSGPIGSAEVGERGRCSARGAPPPPAPPGLCGRWAAAPLLARGKEGGGEGGRRVQCRGGSEIGMAALSKRSLVLSSKNSQLNSALFQWKNPFYPSDVFGH